MEQRREPMRYLVSLRLTKADQEKLHQLCVHTRRRPGEVLRLLLRLAEPVAGEAFPVHVPWDEMHDSWK